MDALPDVRVTVEPRFRPDHSQPGSWLFQYVIRIENLTGESWQVVGREWTITDGLGRVTTVAGEGVVGQMPIVAPGGVYVYDSFVTLEVTPGRMSGTFLLRDAWNAPGRAAIPEFELRLPVEFSEMEEKVDTPARVLN